MNYHESGINMEWTPVFDDREHMKVVSRDIRYYRTFRSL